MASKPKKADLQAKCDALGIEYADTDTVSDLLGLIKGREAASDGAGCAAGPRRPETAAPGADVRVVSCPGYKALNLRAAPSAAARVCGELPSGSSVVVEESDGAWAKVEGGFCMVKYLV